MPPSSPAEPSAAADVSGLRIALPALAGGAALFVLWRAGAGVRSWPARVVPAAVPVYVALVLATVALHARRSQLVLRRLGSELPLRRLMRLWLAGRAVGSLIPSGTLGGEPVRAHLLTASGVPAARAAGAVALDRALELAGNTLGGPAYVGVALALGAASTAGMLVAGGFALTGFAALVLVYARARRGRAALAPLAARPLRFLPARWRLRLDAEAARADRALQDVLIAHPTLVPVGLGLSLAIEVLHVVELVVLFAVFALAVPLPLVLVSAVGIGVAHAVPVTAALGTLEATQVGLFTMGGEPLATGVAVALILRLAETVWILVGLACLAARPGARR